MTSMPSDRAAFRPHGLGSAGRSGIVRRAANLGRHIRHRAVEDDFGYWYGQPSFSLESVRTILPNTITATVTDAAVTQSAIAPGVVNIIVPHPSIT